MVDLIDGRGKIINGLKLQLAKDVMTFFQQDTTSMTINITWGLLVMKRGVFMWWFLCEMWLELGDLMRERIVDEEEKVFEKCYDIDAIMVIWCL